MRQLLILLAGISLAACGRAARGAGDGGGAAVRAADIVSADQLVAAMRARYDGKWYRTITFVQTSTFLRPDGTPSRVETWYEAATIPGRLRIDLGDVAKGNGVLYRGDSVYQFQGGKVTHRTRGRNLLMTLGFDVYAQPVEQTLAQLRAEKIDVSVLHRDSLDGRPMYVVGAGPRDTTSNQFWVDAERLLFVRLVQTNAQQRRTQDIRFEKYVQHGGGWVAELVRFFANGRLVFREEYANVRVNVPLDTNLFVPEKWSSAAHWYRAP